MNSAATPRFWRCFAALPGDVKERAEVVYRLWRANPFHPSLEFKQVHAVRQIYSVRIGLHWRALGLREGDIVT